MELERQNIFREAQQEYYSLEAVPKCFVGRECGESIQRARRQPFCGCLLQESAR